MADEKTKVSFGEKIKRFFRNYRSEIKKIVWMSWDQTWKNTLVVLVTVVAIALVVGLLDWGFTNGVIELSKKAAEIAASKA